MKNYYNYIFENLNNPDFNLDYLSIIDDSDGLNEFWISLDDSLIVLSKFNARDPNDVAAKNKIKPLNTSVGVKPHPVSSTGSSNAANRTVNNPANHQVNHPINRPTNQPITSNPGK